MEQAELLLPMWNQQDAERQRFIFEQLTRYFLSPLLSVDQITPVSVSSFGHTLNTFDALIGGEWLRFVPGTKDAPLGVAVNDMALTPVWAQLGAVAQARFSPKRTVTIPPLLVARQAVATDEVVIGQIDITTQVFKGDHFAYVPYKPAVKQLLAPHVQSLDPSVQATWPPLIETNHVRLRQASSHHYQVAIRHDWDLERLQKHLGGFGFTLPSEAQYEYLMSGGLPQLFSWGNQLLATVPTYLPNRFGLTVPKAQAGLELVTEPVAKTARDAGVIGLSPFYRGAKPPVFADGRYRKVAVIGVD